MAGRYEGGFVDKTKVKAGPKNRKVTKLELKLLSYTKNVVGLRVEAGLRRMANTKYALLLSVRYKNEYLPLGYPLEHHQLTDEILKATQKYYKMIYAHGTIYHEQDNPVKVVEPIKEEVEPIKEEPKEELKLGFNFN